MPGPLSPSAASPARAPHPPSGPFAPAPERAGGRLAGAGVLLLALALYAPSLGFERLEVSDASLRALASGRQAWSAGGLGAWLLHLAGDGAWNARLAAWLLHALASLLAFGCGRRLGLGRGAAFLLGVVFAVHPLRQESVAWLSQLGTLLGACAYLGGTWFVLGGSASGRTEARGRGDDLAALGLWSLALLAEPGLVLALPWPLLVVAWRARGAESARPPGVHARARIGLAALLVLGLGSLTARGSWGFALARLASLPLELVALLARWAGLSARLWPAWPATSPAGTSRLALAGAWLALVLALCTLWRLRRRAPLVTLGGFLFVTLGAWSASARGLEVPAPDGAGYAAAFGLELALLAALARVSTSMSRALAGLALVWLGMASWITVRRLGDWSSEERLQTRALALQADEPRALDALGQWHLAHGRLSEAQRLYGRVLANDPEEPRARLHLAELELRRGLIPGQEQHLFAAAELLEPLLAALSPASPLRASVALRLGEAYQRLENPARAREPLVEAVRLAPLDALAWTRLGMVQLQLAQPGEARTAFERALAAAPDAAEAWAGLGLTQLQEAAPDEAEASFERALALEPDEIEARAALGSLQEARGEFEAAERNYRRAVSVNPDYVDALWALGARLAASARGEEALVFLDHVYELRAHRTPHVRAFLEGARLHLARGESEAARERLEAVLAFNPSQAEARALLASLPSGTGG